MRDCKNCKHLIMYDYKNKSYSCELGECEFEPEEQEPILDKIRVEIEMEKLEDSSNFCVKAHNNAVDRILQIIDKYKAESEDQDGQTSN